MIAATIAAISSFSGESGTRIIFSLFTLLIAVMSSMAKTQALAAPTSKLRSTSGLLISPAIEKKAINKINQDSTILCEEWREGGKEGQISSISCDHMRNIAISLYHLILFFYLRLSLNISLSFRKCVLSSLP